MARVHSSSVVERGAELADDVEVGPLCHVHAGVRIDAGTRLLGHVVVQGKTAIGANCTLHPFAVIGGDAQIRKGGESGTTGALVIGAHNVFRESVTVNV